MTALKYVCWRANVESPGGTACMDIITTDDEAAVWSLFTARLRTGEVITSLVAHRQIPGRPPHFRCHTDGCQCHGIEHRQLVIR